MGLLDDVKKQLGKAVDEHGDQIAGGLDKAGAAIDARTGHEHSRQIAGGLDRAKDALDGLDGSRDDITRPAP